MQSVGTKMIARDVSKLLNSEELERHRDDEDFLDRVANGAYDYRSMSPIMNASRLPKEFESIGAGHRGVHKFLVDDFACSVHLNRLPPVNAWAAARYNIPGLVAHESAMRGGETLSVPDLGDPPASWEIFDPDAEAQFQLP